jgi:hypothetical protein
MQFVRVDSSDAVFSGGLLVVVVLTSVGVWVSRRD